MTGLVLGVGGRAGADPAALEDLVASALAGLVTPAAPDRLGEPPEKVVEVATIDRRSHEPGLLQLVSRLGARLTAYPAQTLAAQSVSRRSDAVARHTGTPSVAEAAVLAAGGDLLAPRATDGTWTVALGRLPEPSTPTHLRQERHA